MRVLVTGGAGYLGTHVRRHFGADDLSRRSGLDILNTLDVQMAAEYDLVIHFAAHLDKDPDAAEQVFLTNVEGTTNLLRHIRRGAAFIFASTKDVYGRFADNYRQVDEECPTLYSGQSALEWSKLIAERYVEYFAHQNGFRACIFRMSTIYGPNSEGNTPNFVGHFANSINLGEPIVLPGAGAPRRDLLHVDDLSAACEAFADSVIRHGLYNLGGGASNAVSLSELVTIMEEVSGLQAVISETPAPMPFPRNYVSSLDRITQELDWEPAISVRDGVKKLFAAGGE
jgi:CDP-paratose 2-epimerase